MAKGRGYVDCEVKDCRRRATGFAGLVRVCNMHWMRWYRAEDANGLLAPSDHMNAHELDARLLHRLDREIDSLRPEAAQEKRYVLFSELFVRGVMGAREVYRLLARGLVSSEELPPEMDPFTRGPAPRDVVLVVTPDGERVLRAKRAQDHMIELEESKSLRQAYDARVARKAATSGPGTAIRGGDVEDDAPPT